ncbi:putative PAS/PAC sensor protein [Sulfuricurvum kujiense DSM 16994]|uniref:PAS/PAC sensor protein n=1 Tax=Sulfuricurvum kujiense (strain ATCC BAA-921 / DSM 16994 / JCM 11577 / YK-1) TaxID=709032 RepID=E4U1A8_SULKY|nr:HD domain-containing phosphohydrolase [Sulfuricurvum kujiense]ADR34445.1 putative PAS/PAC sensor protein [Sulfuricurvum kujiense DSM 16994]
MISSSVPTILVVDDEPRNIQVVSNVLKEINECHIIYAVNGEQALQRVEKNEIDLILLDMMMPLLDGLETCKRLKADSRYSSIPIVFLTAKNDEESLIKGFEAGAVDYISKPFLRRELIARVTTHLNLRSAQKTLSFELSENKELLKQYKEIVDISSIVTKSDPSGRITYANDNFCTISGYSHGELLGKSHSIVRHPEVPSSFYKEMWDTIREKRPWQGIVKNLTKEGKVYIVDAVVSPILNSKDEIVEYISLRKDITPLVELKEEIEATQKELILMLGNVGENRSKETAAHVRRVAEYAKILAAAYGLSPSECETLWSTATMHDIGKVGIPDHILNKPGKLTDEEFEIMKTHAETGYSFFKNSSRPLLQAAAIVAHEHHERWDGLGYPRGLSGENIHIFGRITAIADVFDALGTKRVYKRGWEIDEILEYFRQQSGKQFEPKLVELLLANVDQFLLIIDTYQDLPAS